MADELDDGHRIRANSPQDRVIGMLIERTEAVRELHDSMRTEFSRLIETHSDIKSMMARLTERIENHERTDSAAFAQVNSAVNALGNKMDQLGVIITQATTAGLVQKAQFTAGWKVITVIGALFFAVMGMFFGFFNHDW